MNETSEKVLRLRRQDGVICGEIFDFTYNAKRMGGAPTITATYNSFDEDAVVKDDYVVFRGEKYFISQTPTSSKDHSDQRYKYSLEFVSERVTLDNIYLYDVDSYGDSLYAGATDFKFSGTIRDLADRIQLSINQSYGVNGYYKIIVDEGIDEDNKVWNVIEFNNVSVTSALQEFYNTFKIPYYYAFSENNDGSCNREFHVGYDSQHVVGSFDDPLKYGINEALLSITCNNANHKVINKITGVGSDKNIPYYYPNESPDGQHDFVADASLGNVEIDYLRLSKKINLKEGTKLTYNYYEGVSDKGEIFSLKYFSNSKVNISPTDVKQAYFPSGKSTRVEAQSFTDTVHFAYDSSTDEWYTNIAADVYHDEKHVWRDAIFDYALSIIGSDTNTSIKSTKIDVDFGSWLTSEKISEGRYRYKGGTAVTSHTLTIKISAKLYGSESISTAKTYPINCSLSCRMSAVTSESDYFTTDDGKKIDVKDSGITVEHPYDGGVIEISIAKNYIFPVKKLMPPIYRATYGKERFYKASNSTQIVKGVAPDKIDGKDVPYEYEYLFGGYDEDGAILTNEYVEGKQVEHILEVDDIKPTIKGAKYELDGTVYPLDVFAEFAYDEKDNDEIDDEGEYKHPYFYAKLNPLGFNLFDHASERGDMTISMTSGYCSSCEFVIGVDENSKENLVQVDKGGRPLRDSEGNIRSGRKGTQAEVAQDIQNDTTNNSVWIALKKDDNTYGIVYPNVLEQTYPISQRHEQMEGGSKRADTFVITNIALPLQYVQAAEQRLEDEIKQFLIDNNDEKFGFSIKFSRIYLEEHKEDVAQYINENSRVFVEYFGKVTKDPLYVSSYTYKMTSDAPIPEIIVELRDSISENKSVTKTIVNQVKAEVLSTMAEIDVVAQGARAFLRKDTNDTTAHRITAQKVSVVEDESVGGNLNVGGELDVDGRAVFNDTIEASADITVGKYTEILGEIVGGKISQSGDAAFRSVKANSLEVFTLLYNQIRGTSAYSAFDDTATISIIEKKQYENGDGFYKITFDMDSSMVRHPFVNGDILLGYVNSLNDFGYSRAGRCWLRVVEEIIEDEPWSLNAVMYDSSDCPDNVNIEPTANMALMHRGNAIDENADRQSTFFISSKDGNIVQLLGVDKPKLLDISQEQSDGKHYSNYGIVIGKLPEDLRRYIENKTGYHINATQPYSYMRGLVAQDFIQMDYAGQPILTANFKGVWSKDVEYRRTATTYDVVTHDGSLWACYSELSVGEEPTKESSWVLLISKGEDGDMPTIYTIASSLTSIHQDSNGRLNTNILDIWVNAVGAPFNYEIKDQATLDAYNLSVWYNIDGEEDVRTKLIIGSADAIEVEEGGAIIVTEDDEEYNGSSITLESESIDISSVQSKINIYLVRDADEDGFGVDENRMYIPVLRDGNIPIILYSSPTTINIMRDAQDYSLLGNPNHNVYVGAKTSFGELESSSYNIKVINGAGSNYIYAIGYDEDKKSHVIIAYFWGSMEVVPKNVFVEFFKNDTSESMGVLEIPISLSERGLAGPQGGSGAMIQPYGNWIEGSEYKLDKNAKGEVIGKPCVYHIEPNAEKGGYFVLEKDAGADIDIFNDEYWSPMTKIAYIYSDAIMANWAKFGSDKGAVFYDRYLFSQYGITKDGLFDHFSNHQGENGMWDKNGGLSGEFTPSLFIDMYSGTTKSDKFAETLQEYRYSDANGDLWANEIRFNETYNVKFEPRVSWSGNNDNLYSSPRLLAMPLANDITNGEGVILVEAQHDAELDGVKSNIIARANRGWSRKKEGTFKTITGVTAFKNIAELSSASLVLCADPRLLNPYAWRKQGDSVFNPSLNVDDGWNVPQEIGRFVVDSKLTDFILLEAGKQIRLRSCKSGDVLYWYVENSEDFKEVPYEVYYNTDTMYDVDNKQVIKGNFTHQIGYRNEGVVYEYYRRTFASASIAKYYDEKVKNGIAIKIAITANSNAGTQDDWHWEQDITNITIEP